MLLARNPRDGRHGGRRVCVRRLYRGCRAGGYPSVLDGRPVDVVISDMAPNMSGNVNVDLPRAMFLCELALDFARQQLRPGGSFLIKVFQGKVRGVPARVSRQFFFGQNPQAKGFASSLRSYICWAKDSKVNSVLFGQEPSRSNNGA